MNIVIVDDSRLARQELKTLLSTWPEFQVLAEATTVAQARQACEQLQPDVLLLDIHLPGATGFDLLDQLDVLPQVIFTTAYDQYAVQAFERNALDYLLKPISIERLRMALDKAQQQHTKGREARTAASPKGADDFIFVRDGEQCWFARLADISCFEVVGNYVRVCFDGKRPLLTRSLGQLEQRLDPELFFRASRSHLINLRWIERIEPSVSDGYMVRLRDGQRIEISRRQAKAFREQLQI